jgi:hypothetical protein
MLDRSRLPAPQLIAIAQLVREEALQPRVGVDPATVLKYRELMRDGVVFQPLDVVGTPDGELLLVDGWHRVEAAERENIDKLRVRVWPGSREDAVEFAAQCNARHGLPRSEADLSKVVAMLIALPKWRQAVDGDIAKHIHASRATVQRVRNKPPSILLSEQDADKPLKTNERAIDDPAQTRTVTRGDKQYPMKIGGISAAQRKVEPEPPRPLLRSDLLATAKDNAERYRERNERYPRRALREIKKLCAILPEAERLEFRASLGISLDDILAWAEHALDADRRRVAIAYFNKIRSDAERLKVNDAVVAWLNEHERGDALEPRLDEAHNSTKTTRRPPHDRRRRSH